jgi:hypothetical protein
MAGFKSFLSAIGNDVKKVFAFISSPAGQTIIQTGEGVAEAIDPGLSGLFNIANTYITEAVKTEAIATAAGQQSGSGTQKLAAVTSAVTPTVLAYAQQAGLATPTATQIQNAANAIVAFLNAFPPPATAAAVPVPVPTPVATPAAA